MLTGSVLLGPDQAGDLLDGASGISLRMDSPLSTDGRAAVVARTMFWIVLGFVLANLLFNAVLNYNDIKPDTPRPTPSAEGR